MVSLLATIRTALERESQERKKSNFKNDCCCHVIYHSDRLAACSTMIFILHIAWLELGSVERPLHRLPRDWLPFDRSLPRKTSRWCSS